MLTPRAGAGTDMFESIPTATWCTGKAVVLFRQRHYFLYIVRISMLLLFSATLGGGFHWRDTRAGAPAAASRLLSYCQNPEAPPPSRLAGARTHAVSGSPPMVANH